MHPGGNDDDDDVISCDPTAVLDAQHQMLSDCKAADENAPGP